MMKTEIKRQCAGQILAVGSLAIVTAMTTATGAKADEPQMFPFAMPWNDSSKTVMDVGYLNPTPAGRDGFVKPRNGRLYDEKGRRIRFIGVNCVAGAAFPDKKTAEAVAAKLHKFGFNIVRFHHMDADWSVPNIWDPKFKDTQHLNPEALDRLDYFVAQLKKNGVYTNLNLHVSRIWKAADGVPQSEEIPNYGSKPANYFEPRMVELQKKFAHDLLTHLNPYTKMRFCDDPAVAVVELTNENTIVGDSWFGGVSKLPSHFQDVLKTQWNGWLKTKYGSTDALVKAWKTNDKPLGAEVLTNANFAGGGMGWTLELNTKPADGKLSTPEVALPQGATGKVLRVESTVVSSQSWHIQFHQTALNLKDGEPYTLSFRAKANKPRTVNVYTSLDTGDYHHTGLDSTAALTTDWKTYRFVFVPGRTEANHNRISLMLGDSVGFVDFADFSLKTGSETELPSGATLDAASFPLGRPGANAPGVDWYGFLVATEKTFVTTMKDYLRNDVKIKANLVASQANFGGIGGAYRESQMDIVDAHTYWQHPEFLGKDWDLTNWRIGNTSLVKATDGGTLTELARYRVAGKPFTVSEYDHPFPNDYRAESLPMLAAFASVQDWDGYYLFAYETVLAEVDKTRISGFFAMQNDPAYLALMPATATLFLRNDMPVAHEELRLRVPESSVPNQLAKYGTGTVGSWDDSKIARMDALNYRLSLSFAAGKNPEAQPITNGAGAGKPKGESAITWKTTGADALFTADSPSSKVMAGFLGGQSGVLPGWTVQMGTTPRNFGVFTLTAKDGQPTETSKSLLLAAVGGVENTGMAWNADRNSVSDKWGTGPVLAEGLPAQIILRTGLKSATVYALDATGKRKGKVASTLNDGTLAFSIGAQYATVLYEIEGK